MGKRGPSKAPTLLTLAKGNPGKREINEAEPLPSLKMPPCPEHLDEGAKKEWEWISKKLNAEGLLAEIDKAQLAIYCQAYSRWEEAETKVQEQPWLYPNAKGEPRISPYIRIANEAMRDLQRALAQFGMSPAARTVVKLQLGSEEKGNDRWGAYRKRMKARKKGG